MTGDISETKKVDDIWIYSVGDKTFHRSNIKCPMKGSSKAFTINDKKNDEMTVFGFVRNEWKLSDICDHLFPPRYLIKMIHTYFLNEYVHLINLYSRSHWKCDGFKMIRTVLQSF